MANNKCSEDNSATCSDLLGIIKCIASPSGEFDRLLATLIKEADKRAAESPSPRDADSAAETPAAEGSLGDKLRAEWEKAHAEKVAADLQGDIDRAKDAFKKSLRNAFGEGEGYSLWDDLKCASTSFVLYGVRKDLFEIQQFRDELSEEAASENGLRKVDIEVWEEGDGYLKLSAKAWF